MIINLATKTLNNYRQIGSKRTIQKIKRYILHRLMISGLAGKYRLVKVLELAEYTLIIVWKKIQKIILFVLYLSQTIKVVLESNNNSIKTDVVVRLEDVIIVIGSLGRGKLVTDSSYILASMTFDHKKIEGLHQRVLQKTVETCKFVAVIKTESRDAPGLIQVADVGGWPRTVRVHSPSVFLDFRKVAIDIWSIGDQLTAEQQKLLAEKICPAITGTIEKYWDEKFNSNIIKRLNYTQKKPKMSIIVPLYRNLEYMTSQRELISETIDISCEIIYVIDNPDDSKRIDPTRWDKLPNIERVSVIYHCENFGFALACNTGARHAEADSIVFMNSDVLPASPGWGAVARATLEAEAPCLLGARLMFENGAIQHVGTVLRQGDAHHHNSWWHLHPMKGMAMARSVANGIGAPEALTGAWLGCTQEVFTAIGGFSGDYLVGDFEDADLCLRARSKGMKIRIQYDICALHLEGQSFPHETRARVSRQNGRILAHKWFSNLSRQFVAAAPQE